MATTEPSFQNVPSGPTAYADSESEGAVVWLRGEYDVLTKVTLCGTLALAMSLDQTELVVDLSEVRFMDVAILGVIVRARRYLRLRSRRLRLRSPSASVRRIFDSYGLAGLLDPDTGNATHRAGGADALGTWVRVPTTEQTDGHSDRSELASRPDGPVCARSATSPARVVSGVDPRSAQDLTANVVGRGGL